MKSSRKIIFLLLILISCGVIGWLYWKNNSKQFKLIEFVSPGKIVMHYDFYYLKSMYDNLIEHHSDFSTVGLNVVLHPYFANIEQSGLELKNIYCSIISEDNIVFYLAIKDEKKFKSSLPKLLKLFKFQKKKPNKYYSKQFKLYLQIKENLLLVSTINKQNIAKKKTTAFFKREIQKPNIGIINTTGLLQFDSTDYATFKFGYDKDYAFTLDWTVKPIHPLKLQNDSILIYNSEKKKILAYTNINLNHFKNVCNQFIIDSISGVLSKSPLSLQHFLKLWNGQFSFQMGGKAIHKTVEIHTSFDENFNLVEEKIIHTDSLPDIGINWGTYKPNKSDSLLTFLPNLKRINQQLQIALLPPLKIKKRTNALSFYVQANKFDSIQSSNIALLQFNLKSIKGKISIKKINPETVRIQMTFKDFSNDFKLNSIKDELLW